MTLDTRLREVSANDLPIFFAQQGDADARHMAAFTASDATDREAFTARWTRVMANDRITKRTVLVQERSPAASRASSYWTGPAAASVRTALSGMRVRRATTNSSAGAR